jgi:chromosome segregation ATPase
LEIRARDRYDALDQMRSELRRLQKQRDALDALVEALRTRDGWLANRAEVLRDHLLELEGQSPEGASAVEKVRTALIDRDEALQQAREDLARARTVAADWEAEVVSVRAQLQRDRAALEGARSWQSQAEEKAKEAEELKASLADKAAAIVAVEEQLRQERAAHKEAEGQLQQERATRQEAECQLQQERLPSSRPGRRSSGSAWRARRHWGSSSRRGLRLRGHGRPSRSGRTRSRDSTES